MGDHNKLGAAGEDAAVDCLISKGYKIKERNWHFGHLEIDIIAEHNNMIIFAEVKSRSGTYFEQPFQAVSIKKQKFIIKAANAYIEQNEIDLEARFDIISVISNNDQLKTDHLEDAFYPTL